MAYKPQWMIAVIPRNSHDPFGTTTHFKDTKEGAHDFARMLIGNRENVYIYVSRVEQVLYQTQDDEQIIIARNLE